MPRHQRSFFPKSATAADLPICATLAFGRMPTAAPRRANGAAARMATGKAKTTFLEKKSFRHWASVSAIPPLLVSSAAELDGVDFLEELDGVDFLGDLTLGRIGMTFGTRPGTVSGFPQAGQATTFPANLSSASRSVLQWGQMMEIMIGMDWVFFLAKASLKQTNALAG